MLGIGSEDFRQTRDLEREEVLQTIARASALTIIGSQAKRGSAAEELSTVIRGDMKANDHRSRRAPLVQSWTQMNARKRLHRFATFASQLARVTTGVIVSLGA
jgi:hypothetical protein